MPPSPRGTGFIDFNRYLEANRPQAEAMAGRLAAPIHQQGQAVERGLVAAGDDVAAYGPLAKQAADVQRRAGMLGSMGGIAASLQDMGPKSSTYGLGANLLDAGLAGAAGGERFQGLQKQYGGLFGRVAGAAKGAQERASVPKPAAPAAPSERVSDTLRQERSDNLPDYKRPKRQRYDFL